MKLTNKCPDSIVFEGKTYSLNLAFNIALEVFEILRDKLLDDIDKACFACALLVREDFKQSDAINLFNAIYNSFIVQKSKGNSNKKVVDFVQDSNYIYASFKQAYNIDLIDEQDKLHWDKYIALFQGLPDNTKISEIMAIRGRDIPQRTKYNSAEIDNLIKLKQYYALKDTETDYQSGLKNLFDSLKQRAVSK